MVGSVRAARPSERLAASKGRRAAAEAEAEAEKGNAIERLLGSLATPALEAAPDQAQSEGGDGGIFGVRSP